MSNHIIDQERQGLWIAATFVIALLALVLSFVNLDRNHALAVGTQIEVLGLHDHITSVERKVNGSAATATPAQAPAAAPAVEPAK
ncbi:MAG: hypothetical protein PSX71_03890 [bacterium]|nr:hypothetical protein [bacterium]